MIEFIYRFILFQSISITVLLSSNSSLQLTSKDLELPEFLQHRLMSEILDVFDIVVCFVCCTSFIHLLLILRFSGVDSFQNTQTSEISISYILNRISYNTIKNLEHLILSLVRKVSDSSSNILQMSLYFLALIFMDKSK